MGRHHRTTPRRAVAVGLGAAVGASAVLAASEWLTWRASVQALPLGRLDPAIGEPDEVVLVLGFASSSSGRVNAVQRWRTRIAVRSVDPRTATFVFSGAATRSERSEAALMADYAVAVLGVPADRVVLEEQARSTWENIRFSLPLIGDAPSVRIASNTFHALRARRYLAQQAPEVAARLRRARDYRPGEFAPLKPVLVVYEWVRAAAVTRRARR